MRTALIHDWLTGWGGAEQVLLAMQEILPGAPIYTSLFAPQGLPPIFGELDVRPSFLQRIPGAPRRHQALLPLMPLAFEQFDLSDYELVLSSSHACAKGVITGPETRHVAYLHTPLRYAWDMYHAYVSQGGVPVWKQALIHPLLHYLRLWDQLNTQRIDTLLCNSAFVQRRIAKYYRREATVVYPPVEVPDTLAPRQPDDFYLVAGRQVPYKRVDLVVEAFAASGRRLVVAGNGPEHARLQRFASERIVFRTEVSDAELKQLYARARALIFPPLEDFGIVPVEAQAAGCPVIAYGRGGALETVHADETGVFFAEQSVTSLNDAITRFESQSFDPVRLHRHAWGFRKARFQQELRAILEIP